MIIDLEDIECYMLLKHVWNTAKLENIEWRRDGKPVQVSKETIDEWKFIGLTNLCFAETQLIDRDKLFIS